VSDSSITRLRSALIWVIPVWLLLSTTNANGQTGPILGQSFLSEDFWQKITIAIVAAILAFSSSYLIMRFTERRKPRAQISYSINTDRALTPFKEELKKDTQVRYQNNVVQNLFLVKCVIRNTGNMVVRGEELRFSFSNSAKILDFSIFPEPEREFGLVEDNPLRRDQTERRVVIDYFPRNRELTFGFIVDGERPELKPYAKNDKEDVEFAKGELQQAKYDEEIVGRSIILVFLLIALPHLAELIPVYGLSGLLAGIIQISLLGFLLPLLPRLSQILARRLLHPFQEAGLHAHDSLIIQGTVNESYLLNQSRENSFGDTSSTATFDGALRPLREAIESMQPERRAEAKEKLTALLREAKGGNVDDDVLAVHVKDLAKSVPASAVVSAFAAPGLRDIAGPITEFMLRKLRDEGDPP
jgi:hypothetical protein